MERKAHNSLNEAALQVQLGEDFGFNRKSKKSAKERKAEEKAKAKAKASETETETVGFGFGAREVPIERSRITGRRIRKKKEKIRIVSTDWPHDAGMDIHDGVEESVLEYFKNYFGDNLNEDTSDEDIMNAVYDLVALRDAVLEAVVTLPDSPDVVKYYGGRRKFNALQKRLKKQDTKTNETSPTSGPVGGLTDAGREWMERGRQSRR